MDRSAARNDGGGITTFSIAAGMLGVLLAMLPGCGSGAGDAARAETPALPPDAIFRLDGHEIVTSSEVDEWLECTHFLQTNASLPQQRRLSLTNFVFPRAVARNVDRKAYETARETADAIHARLLDGGEPGRDLPASESIVGTWEDTGLDVWWKCRDMVPGEWSRPMESIGAFVIWRLVEAPEQPWRPGEKVHIELLRIPYIPTESPRALIQQAMDETKLEVLDPAWEELLPLVYRNQMESQVVTRPANDLTEKDGKE
jgi:hypothetical protein